MQGDLFHDILGELKHKLHETGDPGFTVITGCRLNLQKMNPANDIPFAGLLYAICADAAKQDKVRAGMQFCSDRTSCNLTLTRFVDQRRQSFDFLWFDRIIKNITGLSVHTHQDPFFSTEENFHCRAGFQRADLL